MPVNDVLVEPQAPDDGQRHLAERNVDDRLRSLLERLGDRCDRRLRFFTGGRLELCWLPGRVLIKSSHAIRHIDREVLSGTILSHRIEDPGAE